MAKAKKILGPDERPEPLDMAEAIREKETAAKMCRAVDATLKRLRAERRAWNKRLGVCLRKIEQFATTKET